MAAMSEIKQIKEQVEAELLARSGVTGVEIGYKIVGGQKTRELAIRVLVEEKKDVSGEEAIPKTIDGVKTDVIERQYVLHPLLVPLEEYQLMADTGTYDPLVGGISIGPCRSIWMEPPDVPSAGWYITVGTLGAVVNDNVTGNKMLLSNFHVMCVDTGWSVGDTMTQPSRPDGGSCPTGIVGALERASLGGQVDCAVSSHTARGSQCSITEIGTVTGTAPAVLDQPVRKRGRTTGLTYGIVDSVSLTVAIPYGNGLGTVTLTNQIGIAVDTARSTQFGNNGDSGSVVVNDSREVVGLYFAGTTDGAHGVANPIAAVLSALNVSMCTGVTKFKAVDEGGGIKKTLDDPVKLKFRDDGGGGLKKILDDPVTLKFSDDGGGVKKLVDEGPVTLKFSDDKAKAIDDVKLPALDKRLEDVKLPGRDQGGFDPRNPLVNPPINRPGGMPFVLSTPHHSMAWAQGYSGAQGAGASNSAQAYEAAIQQAAAQLAQIEQMMQQGAQELASLQEAYNALAAQYQALVAEYQRLMSGGQ